MPVDEKRCEAGQRDEPTDCDRHPTHHWCEWCEGWYGVPHEGRCHTAKARKNTKDSGRPSHQCACRYCRTLAKHGYQFTEQLFRGK